MRKPKEKKVLVIDRKQWGRGTMGGVLLDSETGLMCCLGFDALACGIPKSVITGMPSPCDIPDNYTEKQAKTRLGSYECNSDLVATLIRINDAIGITEARREGQLKPLLKQLGYDVVRFVN